MDEKAQSAPVATIKLVDILYIGFRHKWLIGMLGIAGVVGAAVLHFAWPVPYQSEAKLFIKYVVDSRTPVSKNTPESRVMSPDERGETIINTELEILTSLDLAREVADAIGPERVLAKLGGGNDPVKAAALIRDNLITDASRRSSVIDLNFRHRDKTLVQPILSQIIQSYYKRHVQIHHPAGAFDDSLTRQADELRSQLLATEEELRKVKAKAGVISLDDTKRIYGEEISKYQQDILQAEAELAEREATAKELARLTQTGASSAPVEAGATNPPPVPSEKISDYRKTCAFLQNLEIREQDLLTRFTPASSLVSDLEQQIANYRATKLGLEKEFPGLLALGPAVPRPAGADPVLTPGAGLDTELARVAGLRSRIALLTRELDKVRNEAAAVDAADASITDLQRRKELEEENYKYIAASLEQSRIDEALGSGRVSNISTIQAPSPPFRDRKKIEKAAGMALFGGLAAGIGLAFLIEFFLDQSIRRRADVEGKLGVPLLMAIPWLKFNGTAQGKLRASTPLLTGAETPENNTLETVESPGKNGRVDSTLLPFFAALRDNLISLFEIRNMTHKPKLVALTSCGQGSGVSTIASGLAAALSETGDGNVLLVDMNFQNGGTARFHHGNLVCDLDDALQMEKRDQAMVQEKLYMVSEATDQLPAALPRRFKNLVPRLKASDYDYIIFDMPPMSQISLTPRLSRYMDVVLMVVESGKTDRELVHRACTLLSKSHIELGVILNKQRNYLPGRFHFEI